MRRFTSLMGVGLMGAGSAFLFAAAAGCVGENFQGSDNGAPDGANAEGGISNEAGAVDGAADSGSGTDGSATTEDGGVDADAGDPIPASPVTDAYFKASNPQAMASFGGAIAMAADGRTLVVGASGESSNATGVNGNQNDTSASNAGAVYVFTRPAGGAWTQQAYLKASNTNASTVLTFGCSVSVSSDGNRVAVGAKGEDSTLPNSGAVYLFQRTGIAWAQIPGGPIKASNVMANAEFGSSVALSGDGNALAVGAFAESSNAVGVTTGPGGPTTGANVAGAVYAFTSAGTVWTQTHYIKPANTQASGGGRFGWSVALSGDGSVLAVGAIGEASSATGVSGTASADVSAPFTGAAYIFQQSTGAWQATAYVKASNARQGARFGQSVALSGAGATLAVGSDSETSGATGVNNVIPGPGDTTAANSGAAYVFSNAAGWTQTAYVKASNAKSGASFGRSVGVSVDGRRLVVGSPSESGDKTGVNNFPGQTELPLANAGAGYAFALANGAWTQTAYLKSFPVTRPSNVGVSAAITNLGFVAVGGSTENSNNVGVNGTSTGSLGGSGAAYTFK